MTNCFDIEFGSAAHTRVYANTHEEAVDSALKLFPALSVSEVIEVPLSAYIVAYADGSFVRIDGATGDDAAKWWARRTTGKTTKILAVGKCAE